MSRDDRDDELDARPGGRPADIDLAVRLLAGSVAFNLFKVFQLWSGLGPACVAANPAFWIRPMMLGMWAAVIASMWKGSSWARNLVLLAIALDILGLLTGLLFTLSVNRMLGLLSWVNLLVELFTAYLLLQDESLDWFR